jgi:uncharacterized delta-60 repeat protein
VAIYPSGSPNAGKIVAVGASRDNQGKVDTTLVRYNPDGSLDATFGAGGIVVRSLHSSEDQATAVALVGDKILVGGWVAGKPWDDFVLSRFNANGTLDQTFGSSGKVVTSFGSAPDLAQALAVQGDGKIILAGTTSGQFAVARYHPNGTLDASFGKRGRLTIDVGESLNSGNHSYRSMDLALSGDRIVLVGWPSSAGSGNVCVVQLTSAGKLDSTFGTGGVVRLAEGFSTSLAVQPDGKLIVASRTYLNLDQSDIRVTRLLANGSPDAGFGIGGTAFLQMSKSARPSSVEVDPLGRVVLGGWEAATGETGRFFVARFTAGGAVDTSFGVDGVGTPGDLLPAWGTRSPAALALQEDGKIVLVGEVKVGTDYRFAAARFEGDAALLAASLPRHPISDSITADQVQPQFAEALRRWQAFGVDASVLGAIDIRITNLGGTTLGLASGNTIWLDSNAAGWGWFVDPTPWDDSEFTTPGDEGEQGRMDLLTVLMHEIGHVLGHEHEDDGVMADTLGLGVRHMPNTTSWSIDAAIIEWVLTHKK